MDSSAHPILCLNRGSSSLKFALYRMDGEEALLASGAVEAAGVGGGRLRLRGPDGEVVADLPGDFSEPRAAVRRLFAALAEHRFPAPAATGHRLVHGGPEYAAPRRVEPALLAGLRRLIPLAPLHLPAAIAIIEAVARHDPALEQVACFDTAFHRGMPEVAQRFPLARVLWDEGVRRYGFHGLSYEYIMEKLGTAARRRAILAHLGNGASLVAVRDGRPLDTTMGLTPIGGVLMGTRSGDLDPGVLLYLLREKGYDAGRLERAVNEDAGLLGISGSSSDMKSLLAERDRSPHAAEAVAMFCYSVRKQVGALAAVLGGLDTLVFTGGIGERASRVRSEICEGLGHLGVVLDEAQNAAHAGTISGPNASCTVRVIPTNEDLMIARHTREVLFPER